MIITHIKSILNHYNGLQSVHFLQRHSQSWKFSAILMPTRNPKLLNLMYTAVGTSPIALIGTRFPSSPVCADWQAPLDFLVGARIFAVSGVFFLLIHCGEEAFSDVDQPVFPMSWISRCLIFVMGLLLVLSTRFEATFFLLVSVGVFPGSFPSLIGLSCCFFWVNFTGRPVCLLKTWRVVLPLELRYLKNANRVLFIPN